METARSLFKRIYKIVMILVTLMFGVAAVAAYVNATPGNGLLLVCGILAWLTLMAGLSITKLEDQDRRAETARSARIFAGWSRFPPTMPPSSPRFTGWMWRRSTKPAGWTRRALRSMRSAG